MLLQPREYQTYGVDSLVKYFDDGNEGNPVIAAPTGTGKSVMIAMFCEQMAKKYPGIKIQVLTHVKELIDQNFKKFLQMWPQAPAGIYSASLKRRDTHNNIIFGGIQSVGKKAHLFGMVHIIIVDEAHMVNPDEATLYSKYIAMLKVLNPKLKVIGLTATPWRRGMGSITEEGGIFTDICCDMTGVDAFNWFIDSGYLVPLVPARTSFKLDTTGVGIQGGDYNAKKLQVAVNRADITRRALREVIELAGNRKSWLIFASGVEHAKDIVQMLEEEFQIRAKAVYSKGMEETERDSIINEFKAGTLRVVVNNNILTTGFDHPGLDLIVCLRPTLSSVLWVQMLGRGTRPDFVSGWDLSTKAGRLAAIANSDKLNCMVLDFAGNARKLGPINDPVLPHKKGAGAGAMPVKECEACGCENHASARFCGGKAAPNQMAGFCGAEFVFKVKIEATAATTEIIRQAAEAPLIEEATVETVQYGYLARGGRPTTLLVTYQCGLNLFKDYICLEHPKNNYAYVKAASWWRQRSNSPVPGSVMEALDYIDKNGIATPTHIRANMTSKFRDILAYCYDNTCFGKIPQAYRVPEAHSYRNAEDDAIQLNGGVLATDLNDIPF